jgi:hypothetical protein
MAASGVAEGAVAEVEEGAEMVAKLELCRLLQSDLALP